MKKVLLIAALTTVSFAGFSQDKKESKPLSFSVGVDAGLPIGDFGDGYSFGIGGSAQADYKVADKLALTLNTGYMSYSGKSISVLGVSIKNPSLGVIPIMAGTRYWFSENLYGSAQLGVSIWSFSGGGGSETSFTWAPGIGYRFSNIDLLLKYNSINATGGALGSIGLRAAYNF